MEPPQQQDPQRLLSDLAEEYERSRRFLQQLESSLTRRTEPELPSYAPTTPSGADAGERAPDAPAEPAHAGNASSNLGAFQRSYQERPQQPQRQQQQQQPAAAAEQAGGAEQPAEKPPESGPSKLKAKLRSLFARRVSIREEAQAPQSTGVVPAGAAVSTTAEPVVRAEAPVATLGRGISARRASFVTLGGGVVDVTRVGSGRASIDILRDPATQPVDQAAPGHPASPAERPVSKRRASLIFYSGGVIDASRAAAAARASVEIARETPTLPADPAQPAAKEAAPTTGVRRASVVYFGGVPAEAMHAVAEELLLQQVPTAPRRPATARRASFVQFADGGGAGGGGSDAGRGAAGGAADPDVGEEAAAGSPAAAGAGGGGGGAGGERPTTARRAAVVYLGGGGVLDSSELSDLARRSTSFQQQRAGAALQPSTRLRLTTSARRISIDVQQQQQQANRSSLEGRQQVPGASSGELPPAAAPPRRGSLDAPRPASAVRPFMGSSLSFNASALYQTASQADPLSPGTLPLSGGRPTAAPITGAPPLSRQPPGPQVSVVAWASGSSPLASPGSGLSSPADGAGLLRPGGGSSSTSMRRAPLSLSNSNSMVRRNPEDPALAFQGAPGTGTGAVAGGGSEDSSRSQVVVTAPGPVALQPAAVAAAGPLGPSPASEYSQGSLWAASAGGPARSGTMFSGVSAGDPASACGGGVGAASLGGTPMRARYQPQPQPQPPQTPQQPSFVRVRSSGGTVMVEGAARARRGSALVCGALVEEHMAMADGYEGAMHIM